MTEAGHNPQQGVAVSGSFAAFDCPVVAEAGAGTGKTTVLVARVVAWCMGPGWSRAKERLTGEAAQDASRIASKVVEGVVAITFTDAAAAEMAERVGSTFRDLAMGSLPDGLDVYGVDASNPESMGRAAVLLTALDRLTLTTIHAYCRSLLVRFPFEARLHPGFLVDADGRILEETVQEVVEDALRLSSKAGLRERIFEAAELGLDPPKLAEALIALASTSLSPNDLDDGFFQPDRIIALIHRISAAMAEVVELISGRIQNSSRTKNAHAILLGAQRVQEQLSDASEMASMSDLSDLVQSLDQAFPTNLRSHLGKWGKERFSQAEAEGLDEVSAPLATASSRLGQLLAHTKRIQPEIYAAVVPIFREMMLDVHERMRTRGAHTFSWLLRDAHALLRDHPDVLRTARKGIDQLFVDEFQDTDPLQCSLVRMLALTGSRLDRPGLFLVGDPKQSIYGWRSADIRAYAAFVSEVLAEGGVSYNLTTNYRSAVPILEEVERVMEPVMKAREGVQPPFVPLSPSPQALDGSGFVIAPRVPVEHWVSWGWDDEAAAPDPKLTAAKSAVLEASAIAEDLLKLRHESVISLWSEIGILFRSTGDLEIYLAALRDAGIPYVVERDRNYYRRREVIEAAALMRVIVDPCDDLALLTFFRTALVGAPDAALLPLWRSGVPELMARLDGKSPETLDSILRQVKEVAQKLPSGVPGLERVHGWEVNFRLAIKNIDALRRSFLKDPADLFIDQVRGVFLLEISEAARYLGAYRVANVERFFQDCRAALQESGSDLDALLGSLRRNVQESREAEEAKPGDAAEDAVQIMTIHKSKGLAFQHVYCVQLHKESAAGRGASSKPVEVEKAHGTDALESSFFGAVSPGFDLVEAQRKEVEAAERVRTLYVALTRAKKRLVMIGRWKTEADPQVRSHMDLLWARADKIDDLHGAMIQASESGSSYVDEGGARWVFPALSTREKGGELAPWSPGHRVSVASMEEVDASAAAVAAARVEAVHRMSRGFSGTASGEKDDERHHDFFQWEIQTPVEDGVFSEAASGGAHVPGLAAIIGTGTHRLLENMDLFRDPDEEVAIRLDELRRWIESSVEAQLRAPAWEGCCEVIKKMVASTVWERFYDIRDGIVGRELPFLMPPDEGVAPAIGFISGSMDLVYQDPGDKKLVVADYKTDRAGGVDELIECARGYAGQGRIYAHAMKRALGLDYEPCFELWFLRYGVILRSQRSKTPRKSNEKPRV